MGWQRSSSRQSYNSMSGNIFHIGKYPGRIIDCVVFSTACKQCEISDKNNETTVGEDEGSWHLSKATHENLPKT